MYSLRVTDQALADAERRLNLQLTRHPLGYIEASIGHFDDLMQEDGTIRRPLTLDERAFVRNERIVCQLDYSYWRSRYAWIKHYAENRFVRYEPNVAQRMMNDIRAEMEEEGIAIFIQQLKSRQLGATTDTEMCIAHRVQFYPNVNAVVASSRPEKSEEMSDKMSDCWKRQPWWLLPRQTSGRAGALIEFGDLNSFVSIQHGAQLTGIARGTTPNVIHLSELCEFLNPEELVDASLMRAVHHSPFTFFVMESTALGEGNWWHNTWLLSKEGWPSRTSDFRPIFLPWFIGTDINPDATWLRAHPVPPNWDPLPISKAHRERCEAFVQSNSLLRRHLGLDWRLPDSQLWWWEVQRNIAIKKKELAQFYMETPSDDIEAFQSTGVSIFDPDTIEVLRNSTSTPLAVFGFVGNSDRFPLRMQPTRHEIDANLPRIPLRARLRPSQPPIECDLVPLRFDGYSTYNEMSKLLLWEMPEDNEEYGIGIDTAEGIGQDRTVMEVLRKGSYYRNDAFVAEFASPNMNSLDIFPYAFVLGCFFSTKRQEDDADGSMLQRPRFVIECRWNGENVQLELQKKGWPNFHRWTRYHKAKYDLSKVRDLGWYSNQWSRPMMMDVFIKAIRDGYIEVPSPYLVEELRHLESSEDAQDARACFLPGTKVSTWNFSRRPIQNVQVGMEVLSHEGKRGMVSLAHTYQFNGSAVEFRCAGLPEPVSCTPNHLFWGRLRSGQKLRFGWRRKHKREFPSGWFRADQLAQGDWIGTPKRHGLRLSELKPEWAYVAGFWLAEGNLLFDREGKACGLEFTNTNRAFIDRCHAGLRDWFPTTTIYTNQFRHKKVISCRYYLGARKRTEKHLPILTFHYYSREAAEWFQQNLGEGSRCKRLSQYVYEQQGLLPLVSGFIDGDGSQRSKQEHDVNFYTSSENLAWQLRQVLLDNGVWCTLRPTGRDSEWCGTIKAAYLSKLYPCKVRAVTHATCRRVIEDETHFYAPIRSLRRFAYSGPVHDLTVDCEHTYTANGLSCHNSYGYHDDRVMAAGIVYFSLHILEMDGTIEPMRDRRRQRDPSVGRAPVYQHPYTGSRDLSEVSGSDLYVPDHDDEQDGESGESGDE